ncbi:MAG: hypothetical protein IJK84_05220 [Bacteroidales bacterium]|nr:hypothetical protein [Bacteroidales bacterium]
MANIFIACNNDPGTVLHNFMQSCADEARQICVDNNHNYTYVGVPELTEANVIPPMADHKICFIAAHGDEDGVYNENDADVVTTRTTNYNFANKGFYSISCLCAQNLCPNLMRIGLSLFVGYSAPFYVGEQEDAFLDCAIEGLKQLLNGQSKDVAYKIMLNKYDKVIDTLPFKDKILLLHNKESLVFAGDGGISLSDLM